ncbi:phosphoglycolate phosphatase [Stappia aggregata IAM 12614]|uniref:Phosphoglycolate phosphatase n=2 Tax=Roseibium aggregatum TaxID=187304 RepID=A0NLX9_ROSAI|nr:phosphoglycolate phosphatase [Stappia aggregata IAM 12614] [Roseibium aggregatum IAM 12614]
MEGGMKPILIFDLDGTLIDSAQDLHAAASRLLQGEGLPALPLETIRSFIGNGIPTLVDRMIDATDLKSRDRTRLISSFLEDYQAHATDLTVLYPGVEATLTHLQQTGHTLAICTNKPQRPAEKIIEDLGLSHFFDALVGGDSLTARKPDPAGLHYLHSSLGGGPVIYVGDSEVDAETAVNAGMPFALFSEGYRKRPVSEIPHTVVFSTFTDFPALAENLLSAPA